MQRHQPASPVGASIEAVEVGTSTEELGLLPVRAAIAVRESDTLLRNHAAKSRIVWGSTPDFLVWMPSCRERLPQCRESLKA
jgi:hypothetical protein